ncbi:MAG: c-type cytochrome biogenesis protein CcsB [Pseudomonadota bacterium]
MNSSLILAIVTFVYCASSLLYIIGWIFRKPIIGTFATISVYAGVLGHTAGVMLRWVESYKMGIGHAPLSNMYESLVFFAWAIAVVYLFIEYKTKNKTIGAFVAPLAFFSMAYASLAPHIEGGIQPLVPALKSNWLIAHVITCFVGYAAFGISFAVAIMYLVRGKDAKPANRLLSQLPDQYILERLIYQNIMLGFLFLTMGIITGAVWANSAWGSYWSWDPKETWSLITWFVYATVLHARMVKGWAGKRIAYLSIIGFIAVMFTYFGVNYLLAGLHSYAS